MKYPIVKTILTSSILATGLAACGSEETPLPEPPDRSEQPVGASARSEVYYQANPRFFASDNCFEAIRAELPRISSMGCDVLWIMPVCEPGELNAIGSPYCIRDFKSTNSRYGSVADLKRLVDDAHQRGMKVILDWVANHTSWDCSWITTNPEYYAKDASGAIISPQAWPDVAQLDYRSAGLAREMKQAMMFWVENTGIDGFRCDYAEGVPHSFWKDVIGSLRESDPDCIMLAETSDYSFYGDGFDMIYDWSFAPAMSGIFNGGKPQVLFEKEAESWSKVPNGKSILRYAFNHDVAAENDVRSMFGSSEGVKAAYVLAAMLNGTPLIYSSMDVENPGSKLSFFEYSPKIFSASLSDEYAAINRAFKKSASARGGKLSIVTDNDVAIFTRTNGDHRLLVMVNTTAELRRVKTPIALTGETMTDLIKNNSVKIPVSVELEPYSYVIYLK